MNRQFKHFLYYLQLPQTLVKKSWTFVCPLGEAEGKDRGQVGGTRMEEQTLTTELAAVKITKDDAIGKIGK